MSAEERDRLTMSSWARWIAYLVLAALIVVTSCRALQGPEAEAATPPAGATR